VKDITHDLRLPKSGILVRCILEASSLLANPRSFGFFLPQITLSGFLLLALASFHRLPLSIGLVSLVRTLSGEDAVHYPQFFMDMPKIFDTIAGVVNAAVSSIGWTAFLAATPQLFANERPRSADAWRKAWQRIASIEGVVLPVAVVHTWCAIVVAQLGRGHMADSPRMMTLAASSGFAVVALAQILAAYALPAVAIGGLSARQAWVRSWHLATRNFGITAGFVLGPRLAEVPVRMIAAGLPSWWSSIEPETIVPVWGGFVLVSVASTMVTLGSLSRFYLHRIGPHEEFS
jgi:hypothetical protein